MQFIRLGFAFVVTVFVARILGPTGYGIVSSIFMFSSILSFVLDPGFTRSLIRYVSIYYGSGKDYSSLLTGYLFYEVFVGSILAIAFYALAPFFAQLINAPNYAYAFQIYAICIFFNSVSSVFVVYLNGINRIDLMVFYNTIGSIIGNFFSLILVLLGFGVTGYVIGFVVASIIVFSICIIKHGDFLVKLINTPISNALFSLKIIIPLGLSMFASQVTYYVYTWLDKFIILGALGIHSLGIYIVALRFAGIFENIRGSIASALMPYYGATFGAYGINALRSRIYKASKILSVTLAPLLMFMSSLTVIVVPLIYGDSFTEAWSIASIHIMYLAIMCFTLSYSGIPMVLEAKKEIVIRSIIVSSASLGLELLLIHMKLGALGVILGRDLAQALGFIYMYFKLYTRYGLQFNLRSWLLGLFIGFILFVASSAIIMSSFDLWFISPLLAFPLYILLTRNLRLISGEDVALLRDSIPRRFSKIINIIERLLT